MPFLHLSISEQIIYFSVGYVNPRLFFTSFSVIIIGSLNETNFKTDECMKPKKIKSFRDLGGILNKEGKEIVFGKLLRSAHFSSLDEGKELFLKHIYGVNEIVDLRAEYEMVIKPDVRIPGITYYHIPLLTDEENPAITFKSAQKELSKVIKEGGAIKHLSRVYRTLVSSPLSLSGLRNIFDILLEDDENTVLWHCTQGKDRTGICSATVLMALGCDRNTIMKDYLRYNRTCFVKNLFIFLLMSFVLFNPKRAVTLYGLLSANKNYLQAAFDEIDRLYGGDEGFLRTGIGLSTGEIEDLRKMYLV